MTSDLEIDVDVDIEGAANAPVAQPAAAAPLLVAPRLTNVGPTPGRPRRRLKRILMALSLVIVGGVVIVRVTRGPAPLYRIYMQWLGAAESALLGR